MADYDILILGSGSAAFAAALKASELGASVAMTEPREIGGTCVNRGCVPSKTLIRAAEVYHLAGKHPFAGLRTGREAVDFAALSGQKDDLIHALRQHKYLGLASDNERIEILQGEARFVDANTAMVGEREVTAEKFLIATGARPFMPSIAGLGEVPYLTSDLLSSEQGLDLKELPASLLIVGGGFVACELGQMFQRLGTRVTILQRGPQLLSGIDPDISRTLCTIFNEEGVETTCEAQAEAVSGDEGGVEVTARVRGETRTFKAQRLLVATGVRPNTEHLNLDGVGVAVDRRGWVTVEPTMRTSAANIWAAGDVTGPPLATPVAAREGVIAAENMVDGSRDRRMDYRAIPRAVFTDPEVAAVGLTLEEARSQGLSAEERTMPLEVVPRAACIRDTRGLAKMVAESKTGRVLGVHLVAHSAGEIIHEAAVAIRADWTVRDLIDTIHVYPTMAETIRMVAQTFEKDVSKLSCCAE